MAIRLRRVDGVLVALCAARSVPKEGDVYLDDGWHHALAVKFGLDWSNEYVDQNAPEAALMEAEESNNPNRDEWDRWMSAAEHYARTGEIPTPGGET